MVPAECIANNKELYDRHRNCFAGKGDESAGSSDYQPRCELYDSDNGLTGLLSGIASSDYSERR